MANPWRRRRIVDWNTPDGISPDTPVADLNDANDAGRDAFILFSDEERQTLAWVIGQAQRRREILTVRNEKRRWHEQVWARTALVLGAVAAFGSMLAAWVAILTHH